MISKKTLKAYEWTDIDQYFNYIVESEINGNFSQVKTLIKDLGKDQKIEFVHYLKFNELESKFLEYIV